MEDKKVTVVEVVPPPTTPKDNKEAKAGYWFQSLLPSVEDVFKWAPFQLPVTMSKEQRQGIVNKSLFPLTMLLSVQDVLRWAFLFSCLVAVSILVSMIPIPCSKSSWLFRCTYLTPAQEVEVESFGEGFLWLTVPQAAAAVVGLLLPRRHAMSRWLLAFLAIISATVVHYMIARIKDGPHLHRLQPGRHRVQSPGWRRRHRLPRRRPARPHLPHHQGTGT